MASSFKNKTAIIATANTDQTLYTAIGVTSAVIHGIFAANTHASSNVNVTLKLVDSSNSNAETKILNAVPIPPNTTLVVDKPVNLEVNDKLFVQASSANCEFTASVLEIT
jgi:hypothetical protein